MTDTNDTRTWGDYLDEVDAELADLHTEEQPEPTEEEKRYQARKEANDLANTLALDSALTGFRKQYVRADPLAPDASASDIAARLRV